MPTLPVQVQIIPCLSRDQVNSNNPCCCIFDACQFGLPELLTCAPFGIGTNSRTFRFHSNNSYFITQCTCTDLINCKIAVAGAFSSNHFNEAQDMVASVGSARRDVFMVTKLTVLLLFLLLLACLARRRGFSNSAPTKYSWCLSGLGRQGRTVGIRRCKLRRNKILRRLFGRLHRTHHWEN